MSRFVLFVTILGLFVTNTPPALASFVDTGTTLPGIIGTLAWGDYDRDGKLDLALQGENGSGFQFRIFNNYWLLGGLSDQNFPPLQGYCAWGDYNGSGMLSIITTGYDHAISSRATRLYGQSAIGFPLVSTSIIGVSNGPSLAWGDYNNDGRLDIALAGATDSGRICRLYRNDSGGVFTDSGANFFGTDLASVTWVDYDKDGDSDLAVLGSIQSRIYRNNGNGTFTAFSMGLPYFNYASAAWADYDNDGWPDLAVCGQTLVNSVNTRVTRIYKNNGNSTFTLLSTDIEGVQQGCVAWGDYDNDGRPDLAITGRATIGGSAVNITRVYRNEGAGVFTDINAGMLGLINSRLAWGDYNGDHKLDLIVCGYDGSTWVTKLYRNSISRTNERPTAPTNLTSEILPDGIFYMYWGASTDAETPSAGLSYNAVVEFYSGSTLLLKVAGDVLPSGVRTLPATGNAGQMRAYYCKVPAGTNLISWQVQSIDSAYEGSPLSAVATRHVRSISGQVTDLNGAGMPGVAINLSSGGSVTTDGGGYYKAWVPWYWSGNITPVASPNIFNPSLRSYTNISSDMVDQNFAARLPLISGYIRKADGSPLQGVTVSGTSVTSTVSAADGSYQLAVPYGWSGTVTPALSGWQFTISSRSYSNVMVDVPTQDYQAIGFVDTQAGLPAGYAVASADFDNDGDLDIAISTETGTRVYRNDGGGAFSQLPGSMSGADVNTLVWFELDNDGYLDLAFSSGGNIYIYRNTGAGGFTEMKNTGLPKMYASSLAWGDFDNDGRQDLAACGRSFSGSRITLLFRNNGDGTFAQINAGIVSLVYSGLAWGDYDNDGDLDLAITGIGGNNEDQRIAKIYRNDGNRVFTDIGASLDGYAGTVTWADYDRDGDLDLIVAGAAWFTPGWPETFHRGTVAIFRNNGGGSFTAVDYLQGSKEGCVALFDWDNDGDLDLAIAGDFKYDVNFGPWPRFTLWRNDGGDQFEYMISDLPGFTSPSFALGDYDNDGDLDIAIAGKESDTTRVTRILRSNTPRPNTQPTAPSNLSASVSGLSVTFSWNAGNDAECGPGGLSYNLRVGTSPGSGDILNGMSNASGFRGIPATGNVQKRLSWTLRGLPPGTVYWSVQSVDSAYAGSPWAEERSAVVVGHRISGKIRSTDGSPVQSVSLVASSGGVEAMTDATGSYILGVPVGWSGKVVPSKIGWYFNPASRSYSIVTSDVADQDFTAGRLADINAGIAGLSGASAAWGDFDNDGDLDLAVMGSTTTNTPYNPVTRIYRNDNGTFTDTGAAIPGLMGDLAWGDFDNDGDLDLCVSGTTSYPTKNLVTQIYRNDSGVFTDINAGLPGVSPYCIAWADYDNDGRLDLAFSGSLADNTRIWRIYRNQSGTFVDSGVVLPSISGRFAWGDFDNDGDLDLAISGWWDAPSAQRVAKIMRNDNGAFVDTGGSLLELSEGSVTWVDYDCDGRLDLAITGMETYHRVRLYRNIGNGAFAEVSGASSIVSDGTSAAWGDFDNDGYPDLALMARGSYASSLYTNNGDGTFTNIGATLPHLYLGDIAWGDYDSDGDLDLFVIGMDDRTYTTVCRLYRNEGPGNLRPSAPGGLSSSASAGSITFSWNQATDVETPANGLTYNLRVGSAPGKADIFSGMADLSSGIRRLPAMGNAQKNLSWTINGLLPQTHVYYWSVQTIDSIFSASPWASEQMATLVDLTPPTVSVGFVTPPMAAVGDKILVGVTATDDVGVTSVTANGTELVPTSRNRWEGKLVASKPLGTHQVIFTATDAAGNTGTATGTYKTARVVGTTCRNADQQLTAVASTQWLFCFWGRVTIIDSDSFMLSDGSDSSVKVIMPGHTGISDGQFVAVRGILDALTTPPTLLHPVLTGKY